MKTFDASDRLQTLLREAHQARALEQGRTPSDPAAARSILIAARDGFLQRVADHLFPNDEPERARLLLACSTLTRLAASNALERQPVLKVTMHALVQCAQRTR
jgi:hypothetical protein